MEETNPGKEDNEEQLIEIAKYKELVEDELTKYKTALDKAEREYENLKNRTPDSVTFTESQQKFLDDRPNYAEYLKTVAKFHEALAVKRLKKNQELKASLRDGDILIRNSLYQIFKS